MPCIDSILYRFCFSCKELLQAPLLIGCNLGNMTDDTVEILSNSEVIAVNQGEEILKTLHCALS